MHVNNLQQQVTTMKNIMLPLQTKYEKIISELQQTVAGLEKRLLTANNYTTHETKKDNISTSIELLNQNITDLNLRQQLYENTSYNGRLVWKIDDIVKRKTPR